jgi:hypothetical protein
VRVVHLDIEAERRPKAHGEVLNLLCFHESSNARAECLEMILVLDEGACLLACRQLAEGVGAQGGTWMYHMCAPSSKF